MILSITLLNYYLSQNSLFNNPEIHKNFADTLTGTDVNNKTNESYQNTITLIDFHLKLVMLYENEDALTYITNIRTMM